MGIFWDKNTADKKFSKKFFYVVTHGLRTPNEGINQRNLKIRADSGRFGRQNIEPINNELP